MGEVVRLTTGRALAGRRIPKPVECDDCGEDIETGRIQLIRGVKYCVWCATNRERRERNRLEAARDRDIVIIRG